MCLGLAASLAPESKRTLGLTFKIIIVKTALRIQHTYTLYIYRINSVSTASSCPTHPSFLPFPPASPPPSFPPLWASL